MARHLRLFGLASLVIVDDDREIDDLIDHPALVRDFEARGPVINRMLVTRLNREFRIDGHIMLSMASRRSAARERNQAELAEKLDHFATVNGWSGEAIQALSLYVATGHDFDGAKAALAYVTAYPFLQNAEVSDTGEPFERDRFADLFGHYECLSQARRPGSLRGFCARLTGGDKRARRALLEAMNGDENGLHAVAVTLDNSVPILQNMRRLTLKLTDSRRKRIPFHWLDTRTAPQIVLRQIKEAYSLPHLEERVPAYTLFLLRMKRSMREDTPAGFEFAVGHWSACPAQRYLRAMFAEVWRQSRLGHSDGHAHE